MHKLQEPRSSVLPGVPWGRKDVLFTPAYWAVQVEHWGCNPPPFVHRLGRTLKEEVVACMLGGHGIPAEVALAAFRKLRDQGYLNIENLDDVTLPTVLAEPLGLRNGRQVRYRFARTKGGYVQEFLSKWTPPPPELQGRPLRNWLLKFKGVGPKTASWIVRNWFDCDDVAILDIHIYRAGLLAGFYSRRDRIDRDYGVMESRFIDFARAVGARPSILDAIIWSQMKQAGFLVHEAVSRYNGVAATIQSAA